MDFSKMDKMTLLNGVKHWVRIEKESTVKVLEYLSEIDRRRIWLEDGYSSLHDFCVRFLGYSEGEAARRMHAARCVGRVPEVKPLLAESRLSLSGVSLIAPHLTPSNAGELLPLVENQSTRKIEAVLNEHFDLPVEEVLKIRLDEELKKLLSEAEEHYSEKDRTVLLKRALKEALAKRRTRRASPVKHTRYVPRVVKREVKNQSDGQCAYRSAQGVRCNQTAHLQFDHVRPWAKGGSSWDAANLRLMCKAHNLFLAKRDFPDVSRAMLEGPRTKERLRINP